MRAVFPNVGDSIFFCLPRLFFYLRGQLFVIQKAKLLHMNTVVNIAPRGLYFHGKVIGMLVVFLGYKILILVFLGSSGKFCAEMKFWYFWVCSFSISSKNEKFPKSSVKFVFFRILRQQFDTC